MDVNAEQPDVKRSRLAVRRLLKSVTRRNLVLVVAKHVALQLLCYVFLGTVAGRSDVGETFGQVGQQLRDLADFGSLASRLLLLRKLLHRCLRHLCDWERS